MFDCFFLVSFTWDEHHGNFKCNLFCSSALFLSNQSVAPCIISLQGSNGEQKEIGTQISWLFVTLFKWHQGFDLYFLLQFFFVKEGGLSLMPNWTPFCIYILLPLLEVFHFSVVYAWQIVPGSASLHKKNPRLWLKKLFQNVMPNGQLLNLFCIQI